MGTVTASTGDTYTTVASWEAIVGIDDSFNPVATGTATLSGTFTEDGIVFNIGNNTGGTLTDSQFVLVGGTINADASSGADFVCTVSDTLAWRDFTIQANGAVDSGVGVFQGIVLQPNGASGADPADTITLCRGNIGPIGNEHFGGAELRGIVCSALPEDSTVNIQNCHVHDMCGYDSGDASTGIAFDSSHPNDGQAYIYNNTVNMIRSSGDCTNYGIAMQASGISDYNLVESVGGASLSACYSPNLVVNGRPTYGGQNNQGVSSDKTAYYNPDMNPFGGFNVWSQDIDEFGTLPHMGRGAAIPKYKIPGYISGAYSHLFTSAQAEAAKSYDGYVSLNGHAGHAGSRAKAHAQHGKTPHFGAYTYKATVNNPSPTTNSYLSSLEGSTKMVPQYLRITNASDEEVSFVRPNGIGVGNSVVVYQGAVITAAYDSIDDALIDCGHQKTGFEIGDSPRVWIEECMFNMHDKKWDAVVSNADQVGRSFFWSSGIVNAAIYNVRLTNRNAIISKMHTNGDYSFNGGVYAPSGVSGGYGQIYNTIINCASGAYQNGYMDEGFNNLILHTAGRGHVHEQGMIDESLDEVSNQYRAKYGNYIASGVDLTDYLRNPDFTEFNTTDDWRTHFSSPSVNKGGTAANYHPSDYFVSSGDVIAANSHPYIDLKMTRATQYSLDAKGPGNVLTYQYDTYDINHGDMAAPVGSYPKWFIPSGIDDSRYVTGVSFRPYGYATLDDTGANRLRYSVTGGVPDPGINEHSDGEMAAPLIPFIDF